jgi:hypothetical protein
VRSNVLTKVVAAFAASAAAGDAAASQATSVVAPLAAYVGYNPSNIINGVPFVMQQAIVAGVRKAVPDDAVVDWVLDVGATATPIVLRAGKLISFACEPRNCGTHQWTIFVELSSGAIDVCYLDMASLRNGQARWYLAAGRMEMRAGTCPSE